MTRPGKHCMRVVLLTAFPIFGVATSHCIQYNLTRTTTLPTEDGSQNLRPYRDVYSSLSGSVM